MTATGEALVQLNKLLDDYTGASRRVKGISGSTEMEAIPTPGCETPCCI
jgi:hypothetical protein